MLRQASIARVRAELGALEASAERAAAALACLYAAAAEFEAAELEMRRAGAWFPSQVDGLRLLLAVTAVAAAAALVVIGTLAALSL
jgi:hypothetical protein